MGIDGIGKGPKPPAGVGGIDDATKTGAPSEAFSISRAGETPSAEKARAASSVDAASPLARVASGEIDVERYLDLKVDEATRPLEGLPPADLAELKKMLRDQMATDPGLIDLVRAATGSSPKPPDES